jgi:hypothetical protein
MSAWRGVILPALPFVAACSFPDVSFVPDDAQPETAQSTGPEMEPPGVDAADSTDAPGVRPSGEGGTTRGGPSGPSGTTHDAGARDAGERGDGGVDCSCDASQMYPANVDCSPVTVAHLGILCSQASGFVGSDPGCGKSGIFVMCTPGLAGLACAEGTMSTVMQQCH